MGSLLLRVFFLPGNAVCSALGVTEGDDRMMVRTLVNILVWNLVVIVGAALLFG
ncbi:MAG TPA: hypothetical protein VMU82_14865 [Acetobacteraceae bacterium]|nr:hypothetical protein [Acetobacteraceae bacterium]